MDGLVLSDRTRTHSWTRLPRRYTARVAVVPASHRAGSKLAVNKQAVICHTYNFSSNVVEVDILRQI